MVIATELEKIYEKIDDEKIGACQLYEEACAFDTIEKKMERVLNAVNPHSC